MALFDIRASAIKLIVVNTDRGFRKGFSLPGEARYLANHCAGFCTLSEKKLVAGMVVLQGSALLSKSLWNFHLPVGSISSLEHVGVNAKAACSAQPVFSQPAVLEVYFEQQLSLLQDNAVS